MRFVSLHATPATEAEADILRPGHGHLEGEKKKNEKKKTRCAGSVVED